MVVFECRDLGLDRYKADVFKEGQGSGCLGVNGRSREPASAQQLNPVCHGPLATTKDDPHFVNSGNIKDNKRIVKRSDGADTRFSDRVSKLNA